MHVWLVRETQVPNQKPGTTKSQDYSAKFQILKVQTLPTLGLKHFEEKV